MSVVEVDGLVRRFGDVEAVRTVSFRAEAGELYGLVGPDGAGKSTIIGSLAGLLIPHGGQVRVFGEDPADRRSSVRHRLGLMPQEYSLYGDLTIAENLHFFGDLFGIDRKTFRQRRDDLLEITRLARFVDRRADALSGGMYKKLALSCALLHRPQVLLLDEPTNGVDPVSRRDLWSLIYDFVADGMTVLVCTPYMDEAARCHRVGLMHEGRLVTEGEPAKLTASLEHEVAQVEGGNRDQVHALLDTRSEVVAASPAGERLRVVIRPGATAELENALAPVGATLRIVDPDFEDLFLARVAS